MAQPSQIPYSPTDLVEHPNIEMVGATIAKNPASADASPGEAHDPYKSPDLSLSSPLVGGLEVTNDKVA